MIYQTSQQQQEESTTVDDVKSAENSTMNNNNNNPAPTDEDPLSQIPVKPFDPEFDSASTPDLVTTPPLPPYTGQLATSTSSSTQNQPSDGTFESSTPRDSSRSSDSQDAASGKVAAPASAKLLRIPPPPGQTPKVQQQQQVVVGDKVDIMNS